MKKSELKKLAWVFFALAMWMTPVFGQGWRNANQKVDTRNLDCIALISGLSDEQKTKITTLESSHQETMAAFREERRSTVDVIEKNEIRGEMLKNVLAHRKEVRNLLNEEQQKEYDLLQARGNMYRNQPRGNACRGNQSFRGNRGFAPGNRGFATGNGRGCPGYGYGNRNRPGNFRNYPMVNP
jgi:hypothetical protein